MLNVIMSLLCMCAYIYYRYGNGNRADIHIEQRPAEEVTQMWYKERMAPEGVKVYNPAFDVTDNELITAIVTEYGVARAPYKETLQEIFRKKEQAQKAKE